MAMAVSGGNWRTRWLAPILAVLAGLVAMVLAARRERPAAPRPAAGQTGEAAAAAAPAAEPEAAVHLPGPSVWPVATGAAVTLLLAGLVTNEVFSLAGLVLLAGSLAGWIGELRHGD